MKIKIVLKLIIFSIIITSCTKENDPSTTVTGQPLNSYTHQYVFDTSTSVPAINAVAFAQTIDLTDNYMMTTPCLRIGIDYLPNPQVIETDSYMGGYMGTIPVTTHFFNNDTIVASPQLKTMTGRYELRGVNKDTLLYSFSVNFDSRYFIVWYLKVN